MLHFNLLAASAGLGCLKLEYDANKNPAIFQQLCELKLEEVIDQASYHYDLLCPCHVDPLH